MLRHEIIRVLEEIEPFRDDLQAGKLFVSRGEFNEKDAIIHTKENCFIASNLLFAQLEKINMTSFIRLSQKGRIEIFCFR